MSVVESPKFNLTIRFVKQFPGIVLNLSQPQASACSPLCTSIPHQHQKCSSPDNSVSIDCVSSTAGPSSPPPPVLATPFAREPDSDALSQRDGAACGSQWVWEDPHGAPPGTTRGSHTPGGSTHGGHRHQRPVGELRAAGTLPQGGGGRWQKYNTIIHKIIMCVI